MRIGHGYDVHRLVAGRPLILGGVEIPWEKGLLGHSDADVLTHAVREFPQLRSNLFHCFKTFVQFQDCRCSYIEICEHRNT